MDAKKQLISRSYTSIYELWNSNPHCKPLRRYSKEEVDAARAAFTKDTGLAITGSPYYAVFSNYMRDLDTLEDLIKFLQGVEAKARSLGYVETQLDMEPQEEYGDVTLDVTLIVRRWETPEEVKDRARREAEYLKEQEEKQRELELKRLAELKAKYEGGETP